MRLNSPDRHIDLHVNEDTGKITASTHLDGYPVWLAATAPHADPDAPEVREWRIRDGRGQVGIPLVSRADALAELVTLAVYERHARVLLDGIGQQCLTNRKATP